MRGLAPLIWLAVALPAPAVAATPDRQKEALETIAAVVAGRQDARAAKPYFAKKAVFVGATRDPWDIEKFRASLIAGSCGTNGNFWEQDRVLNGLERSFADELRRKGEPEGPGLTFYCAGPTSRAGNTMITFKFDGDKIVEVKQAYFVLAPPYAPAPPRVRSN